MIGHQEAFASRATSKRRAEAKGLDEERLIVNAAKRLEHNQQQQQQQLRSANQKPLAQCQLFSALNRCQQRLLKRLRYNRLGLVKLALGALLVSLIAQQALALEAPLASHQHQQIQARVGGLEPSDYVDEAGELEVMANQQQIPTAQLMAAAGHVVPENFFLPGGSIPALYQHHHAARLAAAAAAAAQHQHQQRLQAAASVDQMQQVASHVQARHVAPPTVAAAAAAAGKFARQADLMAAAEQQQHQHQHQHDAASLIDLNGYNLVAQVAQENAAASAGPAPGAIDLAEFLNPANHYEQQQQQHYAEQQLAAEMAAIAAANQQHQQHQNLDNSAQSSDNSLSEALPEQYATQVGPAYQIMQHANQQQQQELLAASGAYAASAYDKQQQSNGGKPFGLPTKSSSKEPSDMLKPIGNPKTVSSPVIDFVTNQLPKTSAMEQIANKLPQMQTPTVFSFASSKDPSEKVNKVNQKKRTVMRQAEQLARMMIKSVNDKFGTTIGDQTDIPFLLSTLGPLGMAQNILFDPTLLVTLLNSAEKIYFSDALPGPAKNAMRPVLNIFRVPNKKRDKANLLNIISFLASGGQTPSSTPPKHRQGTGVEKSSKSKNR